MEEILKREYLTPRELAYKLNVSIKFITNCTQARKMPGQVKMGRLWRYNQKDVNIALLSGSLFKGDSSKYM